MTTNISRRQCLAALGAALLSAPALAQKGTWPSQSVRVIAPTGAGSGTDIIARLVADKLSTAFKQAFIVENKPGANGLVGLDYVVRSNPDGYVLTLVTSSSTVVNQALQPTLPYDVTKDIVPISLIAAAGSHLVVTPDFPAKTLKEFVDLARANPGKYDYGSWGLGSSGHLLMAWLMSQAKIDLHHVPYKTVPQIYQDLQGGRLQVAWVDSASSIPLIKSGALRALTTSASRRGPALPELPTFTEQGYPFNADAWFGVFAPAGTPADIIDAVSDEMRKVTASADYKARLDQLNLLTYDYRTPAQLRTVVAQDLAFWKDLVQENNISLN